MAVYNTILGLVKAKGWPEPVWEHPFAKELGRKWAFDMAWPDPALLLAVEIEGGTWKPGGGRHNRGKGFVNDIEKYNCAQLMGWCVLRYTTEQVEAGAFAPDLEAFFGGRS